MVGVDAHVEASTVRFAILKLGIVTILHDANPSAKIPKDSIFFTPIAY